MTSTKQFIIDSLSDTFAERCNTLIAQEDNIQDARAIYEEWVVDGIDPEDESIDYEWCFLTVN